VAPLGGHPTFLYYNLKNLAGRIDRLEEIGDTLYLPDAIFYMGLAFSRKGQ
jgi:hypothetical protein